MLSQYALRFLFGGIVTAVAGLVAQHFGPVVAGLLLAFPAIFPACTNAGRTVERDPYRKA
jgi:hypothetical protein